MRYHFEVFSAVYLFGLTANETKRVARLDAYLDIREARITYQEQARVTTQVPDPILVSYEPKANKQNVKALEDTSPEHTPATVDADKTDTLHAKLTEEGLEKEDPEKEGPEEEEDRDPMGHSILDNMEINLVHVLSVDFQRTTSQPNSLDGDVVAKEAT